MSRLIDADELLKHKTDHEYISTHLIYNAPTVDAIPTQAVEDAITEIEQIVKEEKPEDSSWACGMKYSIGIIRKHTGIGEE